jgi:plasmid replication initiation protein
MQKKSEKTPFELVDSQSHTDGKSTAPISGNNKDNKPIPLFNLSQNFNNFMIKNNLFVSIEEFKVENKTPISPLSSTDTQILTTAFLMAHELNERKIDYNAETVFNIDLDHFCQLWQLEITAEDRKSGLIYRNLKNSVARLQSRMFTYLELETNNPVISSYFAYITYADTSIQFGFPSPFIQYLKQMDKFTWYYIENIIKLCGDTQRYALNSYAVILYEHLQKEKNFAPVDEEGNRIICFSVKKLRKLFSISENSYARNIDFKNKIILKVLEMIKDHTSLDATIEPIIEKRETVKYKFICKFPKRDLDFKHAVSRKKSSSPLFTPQQRKKFADLLSNNEDFIEIYMHEYESKIDFSTRIEKLLYDNENVIKHWKYLKEVGCRSKKIAQLADLRE